MLLINGRLIFNTPGRMFGIAQAGQPGEWRKAGLTRNRSVGGFSPVFDAYPSGALAPNAFLLPTKPGGLSSYREGSAAISPTASELVSARPATASATLELVKVDAQLDQIVSATASGSLSLSPAEATLAGGASAVASGSTAISTSSAVCGAIFSVTASASCSAAQNATLTALANLGAEAGGPTPLSPEGLARAVWSEPMDDYNEVGSFGEQLKNLSGGGGGGGGGPTAAQIADAVWDELVSTHSTAGSAGKFIQDLQTELAKRLTKKDFVGLSK